MKRNYLTPDVAFMNIECETIIASSPAATIGIDKDKSGNEQLSNRQQGTWGNVWNK